MRCGGLQQHRHENVEGAEAHAEFAQEGALLLGETLDFLDHLIARQDSQSLDQAESDAAARPGQAFAFFELYQRLDDVGDMPAEELLEPRLDGFAIGSRELIVGYDR